MTNPYQAPTTSWYPDADHRRVWIACLPFWSAMALLAGASGVWFGRPLSNDTSAVVFAILASLLLFNLTTCAYVLVKWLRDGIPPDLVSEFMMTTPQSRELHRELRARPKLDDDVFHENFYGQSRVPKTLVVQLRRILEEITGCDLAGLHPSDNIGYLDPEMDFADVLCRLEREFRIKLNWEEFQNVEVTFDSLLRVVLRCTATNPLDNLAESEHDV